MNRWLKAAAIRAIRTAAQAAIGTVGAASLASQVDWSVVGLSSLLAAALSILMSLAGLPEATSPLRQP